MSAGTTPTVGGGFSVHSCYMVAVRMIWLIMGVSLTVMWWQWLEEKDHEIVSDRTVPVRMW